MKKKTPSISYQVSGILSNQLRIGQSRYQAKKEEKTHNPTGIFSWSTYENYKREAIAFGKWAKKTHGCKYILDTKIYIKEYIEFEESRGLSASSIKLKVSALNKLFGTTNKELGLTTKSRLRKNITRSRLTCKHDSHFSESKNYDVVEFLKGTGLRRHEISKLHKSDIIVDEDEILLTIKGKGGKLRTVISNSDYKEHILKCLSRVENDELVFKKQDIKNRMDIHSYRRFYAMAMYKKYARPLGSLPKKEKYYCRDDKKGVVYDRQAMLKVSRLLGHNRIEIIASHYLD